MDQAREDKSDFLNRPSSGGQLNNTCYQNPVQLFRQVGQIVLVNTYRYFPPLNPIVSPKDNYELKSAVYQTRMTQLGFSQITQIFH